MCNPSWIVSLQEIISRMSKPQPRIAIVGIGNELRGDDAAGVIIARWLQPSARPSILVLDAGPVPENFTSLLRTFAPDMLLLVDATHMDEPPGTVQLLEFDSIQSDSATTHTLSSHLVINYLRTMLDCDTLLLGIQPGQNSLGVGLSADVRQSVEQIVQALQQKIMI
jgi:hydrogenase 3 maturation protease